MPTNFNVENKEDERAVLRGLVSYGYKLISGIYQTANTNKLTNENISFNFARIHTMFGRTFLSRDKFALRLCENTSNWQDYLSSEALFNYVVFQFIVINKVGNSNKTPSVELFEKFITSKEIKSLLPTNIQLEEKRCSLPPKDSERRLFIENQKNIVQVLNNMIIKSSGQGFFSDKYSLEEYKSFIENTFCFGKYSGLVAKTFYNAQIKGFEESEKDDEKILFGFKINKMVGVSQDGIPLYEYEDGKNVGSLVTGVYSGIIYKRDEEDPDTLIPLYSTEEYYKQKEEDENLNTNEEGLNETFKKEEALNEEPPIELFPFS